MLVTPGASDAAVTRLRLNAGSVFSRLWSIVVATCCEDEIVSCAPTTVTSSATFVTGIVAFTVAVCAAESLTVVSRVWNPCSSKRTR